MYLKYMYFNSSNTGYNSFLHNDISKQVPRYFPQDISPQDNFPIDQSCSTQAVITVINPFSVYTKNAFHSFINSDYFYSTNTVPEFHAEAPQTTVSEGLAQGVDSTNAPLTSPQWPASFINREGQLGSGFEQVSPL